MLEFRIHQDLRTKEKQLSMDVASFNVNYIIRWEPQYNITLVAHKLFIKIMTIFFLVSK